MGDRWRIDYWDASSGKEALETLLALQPTGRIAAMGGDALYYNMRIIPEDDRRRVRINPHFPSFRIAHRSMRSDPSGDASVWTREVYGVPIVSILDTRAESDAARRAAYAAARASEPVASAGGFDMYADGGRLAYAKEDCADEDARGWFALSIFPVDKSDLPKRTRDAGLEYEPIHFDFFDRGAIFDGKCIVVQNLPDFPISHIETWRYIPGESPSWSVLIPLDGYLERYRRARASLSSAPAMRSDFDVYLEGGALTYVKKGCAEDDTRGRFFLSVFPADPRDLPQSAIDAGFEHEPLNFDFHRYGAIFDGECVIIRDLPDYPISKIETGQFTPGEGELWSARAAVGD